MNKEAVKRTLDRINGIDGQRQYLVTLCNQLVKKDLSTELREKIVNDIDVHFYDKKAALHNAHNMGTQVTLLPTSIVSNFNYAMSNLLGKHYRVFLAHAKVDKLECAFSVVLKKYSKEIVYEIMVDHSNGFHKQVPYQFYKHIYKPMFHEIKKVELFPDSTVEKIGWLSKKQVLASCRKKLEPLLLNTPFSDRLRQHSQVFFHRNKKEDATGVSKKSFDNVFKGIQNGCTIYVGAIINCVATPHAWFVNNRNEVVELTPRNEGLQVYCGVSVSVKKYKRWYATSPNVFDVCLSEL